MSDRNSRIDWPPWISATCAIVAIFISVVTAFKSKEYYSEYTLVSSDGTVLSHKGFKEYGLLVKLAFVPVDDSRHETLVPEYSVQFAKVPSYFEVTTREGGVVMLHQESPLSYKLRFVGAGYGSPVIQCNFKIQAY